MRSSAKQSAVDNNRGISGNILRLHQRLHHALNLGSWEHRAKWHSPDIEIQRLVLHSTGLFLDCISIEIVSHQLVKGSLVDIVIALQSILEFRNQSLLPLASDVAVKLVNTLPSCLMQSHTFNLVRPLIDLLSSQQSQVAISCAMTLNIILSKLSARQEREMWHILEETKAVDLLIRNVKLSCYGEIPIEYFKEMASVLSKILLRWPSIRFFVWNDSEFLHSLDVVRLCPESSVRAVLLRLYSALALCGNGAEKLLDSGELIRMMVECMNASKNDSIRLEAFKLARCFALRQRGFMKMMNVCCEILVKAVINAMIEWNSLSETFAKTRISVLEEACRLASVTRWAGDHHMYFWREGIVSLLLDLLLDDYQKIHQQQHDLSARDLISLVQESLKANHNLTLRPLVWDILGGLAVNCASNVNHEMYGGERQLNALIICTCSSFVENNLTNMSEGESSARAVLMMVYSPCASLASMSRLLLCEVIKSSGKVYVEYFLRTLNTRLSGKAFGLPGDLQILVCLMSLACYCSSPKYCNLIDRCQGMKILVTFIKWWLNNPVHVRRDGLLPHLHDSLSGRTCCFQDIGEWDGEESLLLFSLWILAELVDHSSNGKNDISGSQANFAQDQLIEELQEICKRSSSPGSRWYAAYILSYFGHFGFPSKLGDRIGTLLALNEHADLKFNLVDQEAVFVHKIIIMIKCPALMHPKEKPANESSVKRDKEASTVSTTNLSAHVDRQSLFKLLEYVYSGCLQATDDLVIKLKILAKHCKLEHLLQILRRRNPRWGTPVPSFDLSPALRPPTLNFSNLILEANTTKLDDWKCNICTNLHPHLHAHKVIMGSGCDYLRGLFRSGMQESHFQIIKVPVSWESLNKLVNWFYSGRLPVPTFDCTWNNLDPVEKSEKALHYLELCWLAKFWLIEDLHAECYDAFVSCLNFSNHLSTKILQTAANLSEWELAQIAADHMGPSYIHLRNSGELDELDDNLVEMVRLASVRLSQEQNR